MDTVFLFPGQGAQTVGMGQDLCDAVPEAKEVFERCEEATKIALRKICFEGPQEELSRTDVCQPAIFAVSAAMLAAMRAEQGDAMPTPSATAGLSLGEYGALYAAGAMDLETTAVLLARRGEYMQAAATATPSSMVCVMGLDEAAATALCEAAAQGQTLTCANFNCPGQIVLSGETAACQRAAEQAGEHGARGAVPLDVAGAFHSEIMRPAADKLAEALAAAEIRTPSVPVYANVDAQPHGAPDEIRRKLLDQLVSPVRWAQCMEAVLDRGAERFLEIGPGKVLAGLMRRIRKGTNFTSVNSLQAVKALGPTA